MRNKLELLFVLTQDLQSPSGLGRYGPMSFELAKLGYHVQVVALHPNYHALSEKSARINQVKVRYVAPMHVKKAGNQKTYYSPYQLLPLSLWGTWQLAREVLRADADIIHIGKPHPMNSLAGFLGKTLKGRTLFLDSDDLEAASTRFQARWQHKIVQRFETWTPRQAAVITTNTHYQRARFIKAGYREARVIYLPNGVDRARFHPPPPNEVLKLQQSLKLEGKKVIAFIGTLSLPSHPVDLLLKAFQDIRREIPNSVLLLVGGGEDLQNLRQLAIELNLSDEIIFCGRVPPEEVPIYYRLAAVSTDPVYDDEAARGRSPLKIFESWACGTPVVTADAGDRARILGTPPAGLLARPGDPKSLAGEIIRLLADDNLSAELSARGTVRVEEYYWDRLVKTLDQAYRRVLGD